MAEYIEKAAVKNLLDRYGGTDDALALIDTISTADVAEVRHGEWIDKPTGRYGQMQSWCTACGRHSGIGGIKSNRHKPYCPNCGARMDKEDEHEAADEEYNGLDQNR